MKIEKISDNQIRCTLTAFDLGERNININELAYGTDKARKLFKEMLQKAEAEFGFETENFPLMVEAVPLSSTSLLIIVTKVEDPEELDTRFSRFTPANPEFENILGNFAKIERLEGADTLPEFNDKHKNEEKVEEKNINETEVSSKDLFKNLSESVSLKKELLEELHELIDNVIPNPPTEDTKKDTFSRIFVFDSLDTVVKAAAILGNTFSGDNILYKSPENKYHLILSNSNVDDAKFAATCNILSEYGQKIQFHYSSKAYYDEHFELIIKNKALQNLSNM